MSLSCNLTDLLKHTKGYVVVRMHVADDQRRQTWMKQRVEVARKYGNWQKRPTMVAIVDINASEHDAAGVCRVDPVLVNVTFDTRLESRVDTNEFGC